MGELVATDEKNLVRDISNMALLSTDTRLRDDYLSKRKLMNENKKLKDKVDNMAQDIQELKELLLGGRK